MSQAIFNQGAGPGHEARSAGSEPATRVHPEVIEAMDEIDIDIRDEPPKALTRELVEWADLVVTMGCGDACPYIPGKRYEDWQLEDPSGQSIEAVRETREEISRRIDALWLELDPSMERPLR